MKQLANQSAGPARKAREEMHIGCKTCILNVSLQTISRELISSDRLEATFTDTELFYDGANLYFLFDRVYQSRWRCGRLRRVYVVRSPIASS